MFCGEKNLYFFEATEKEEKKDTTGHQSGQWSALGLELRFHHADDDLCQAAPKNPRMGLLTQKQQPPFQVLGILFSCFSFPGLN